MWPAAMQSKIGFAQCNADMQKLSEKKCKKAMLLWKYDKLVAMQCCLCKII